MPGIRAVPVQPTEAPRDGVLDPRVGLNPKVVEVYTKSVTRSYLTSVIGCEIGGGSQEVE